MQTCQKLSVTLKYCYLLAVPVFQCGRRTKNVERTHARFPFPWISHFPLPTPSPFNHTGDERINYYFLPPLGGFAISRSVASGFRSILSARIRLITAMQGSRQESSKIYSVDQQKEEENLLLKLSEETPLTHKTAALHEIHSLPAKIMPTWN